jgi:hypothetical protein
MTSLLSTRRARRFVVNATQAAIILARELAMKE